MSNSITLHQLVGYRETRTGKAWPVQESAWPGVPPGAFVCLEEVWSVGTT